MRYTFDLRPNVGRSTNREESELAKVDKQQPLDSAQEVLAAINAEFHGGTDRVVAIVGAAYLDSLLESLIRSVLVQGEVTDRLLDPSGALGSNGSRVALAHSLGLISSDCRADLNTVAKIRNAFAHDFNVEGFSNVRIRDLCTNLKQPALQTELARKSVSGPLLEASLAMLQEDNSTPRGRYSTTIIMLVVNLYRRIAFLRPIDHQWFIHDPDSIDGPRRQ